jgi:hypothetical protein
VAGLTGGNVGETRRAARDVLRSRIVFDLVEEGSGAPTYELTVSIQFDRLLTAAVRAVQGGTSPTRGVDVCTVEAKGRIAA